MALYKIAVKIRVSSLGQSNFVWYIFMVFIPAEKILRRLSHTWMLQLLVQESQNLFFFTMRRPGQRETIILRGPGHRGEHKNLVASPLCEKCSQIVDIKDH